MAWTTVTLEVTTPLFNGGAASDPDEILRQDDEPGVRVASIRGAMRFWFRALAGCLTGPDLPALAAMERRVFGGIVGPGGGAGQHQGATPSPLVMRIPVPPPLTPAGARRDWLPDPRDRRDERKWIIYLLGQGLGDLRSGKLIRPCVEPGPRFDLKLSFRHAPGEDGAMSRAIETLTFGSLWLACAYGGVGARTRRGFGGLRIVAADGPLPDPWQGPGALLTPDLGHYERLRRLWPTEILRRCVGSFQDLAPGRKFDTRGAWSGARPSFPVLSPDYTRVAVSAGDFGDWIDALCYAGSELRHFRADADNPGAAYQPRRETTEWKTTVTGRSSTDFPLGALGLPVGYKDGYVVNANRLHDAPLRRASPLWLRVAGKDSRARLVSIAFHTEFLPGPKAAEVHLWRHGRELSHTPLTVKPDDVASLTGQWMDTISSGGTFTAEHRRQ